MAVGQELLHLFERGRRVEATEKAEWTEGNFKRSSFEHVLSTARGKRGRIDVLLEEEDGSVSIIEIKSTDWDSMAEHRVRPNILRHARQVMKYVYPFWEDGVDVCPGLVYPHAPRSGARRTAVEATLEERCVQVIWADERPGA